MSDSVGDWRPSCSVEMLHQRAALRLAIRTFFDERGYLEVDTPVLSEDIVIDAHLDPISANVHGRQMYLQTSPEACMKRMLAAGSGSIYQVTSSFRDGESGTLHNPEFCMLEWYGVGTTWQQQIELTEALIRTTAENLQSALSLPPFEQLTYQNAFLAHADIDPLTATNDELGRCVRQRLNTDDIPTERDDLLNLLLAEDVEPHLGRDAPVFVTDYPATQAALAELSESDPRVALRFELYIAGVEICNGYQELTDATELQRRDEEQSQRRATQQSARLPGAPRLLSAMHAGLPACSGVALGLDRLLMLQTGKTSLDGVLPFPINRA